MRQPSTPATTSISMLARASSPAPRTVTIFPTKHTTLRPSAPGSVTCATRGNRGGEDDRKLDDILGGPFRYILFFRALV